MQSPNAVHSRREPATILLVAMLAALAACGEDSPKIGPGAASHLPSRSPPEVATPSREAEPGSTEPPTIDVGGRVVDDLEQPIIGRPIVVVDGRGKRIDVMTDEDGGFHAMGVAAPYDLLVTQAPSGSAITPVVYFGLNRADPRLEVFERNGPTEYPASQPLRVGVKLPFCRATSGACWVSVVSASASGGGATAGSYTEGTATAVFDVTHSFHASSPRAGETIAVHVLVGDSQYTQYAYTRLLNVPAHPGEPMDLGMTTPVAVESGEPVTLAGHATTLLGGWQWTLSSQLDLPGGATIALRYEWSPTTTMRLPRLPGATWSVGAWVQHPPVDDRPYFQRASQAWSGTLPLTATNVVIDVPLAPEPLRPALGGALSRRGIGLAWSAVSPGLAKVAVVELAHTQQRFRAYTSDAELPLARLEALGLGRLDPGDHVLDLTTTPGATVDELTQPDERKRLQRFDHHVSGATTYQRFRFQVTR